MQHAGRQLTVDLDVALAGYSKPVGVMTTFGQWWKGGVGHRLQGYLPAVVQHIHTPLYSVYPFPIHDRYEYRYFYDLEIELALCFRPAPALCTELEYLITNKWNLTH